MSPHCVSCSADATCYVALQRTQGKGDAELADAHRRTAAALLQQLGAAGLTLAQMETLPFGIAVPIHEALQLLRDSPPASTLSHAFVVVVLYCNSI